MKMSDFKFVFLIVSVLIPMHACIGLQSDYPMDGVQYETAGGCAQDYDGELAIITEVSGFDAQEDGVSIIGDRSTLHYWNNAGRQYDLYTFYSNGDWYQFYRGDQAQYDGYYEADAINNLVSTYHVYANLSENEWIDFGFDVLAFQDASDPESVDADIFFLEIYQVQESYEPESCEPNNECTERTQSADYSLESVAIVEQDSGAFEVTAVFGIDPASTEHYPETVTITMQAIIDERSGVDAHPDVSYVCQTDYILYQGSINGDCDAGYTDVAHFELTDGRLSQECYNCVVTRNGVAEDDDEGGYALDTYNDDDVLGIVQECTTGLSSSFE